MNIYVGIDGGGTKTKVCILNQDEQMIACAQSGPSSIDTVDLIKAKNEILSAYEKATIDIEESLEVVSVFAGLGGIRTSEDSKNVEKILREIPAFLNARITAKNDTENALASGLIFDEGLALIVGTGMVCFGKDTLGHTHKSGGWGYKEGDAGSAYDLGFQAIKSLARAIDHRIEFTPFHQRLWDTLAFSNPEDFIGILDALYESRTDMAALAPIVTQFANQNDANALKIVDQATDELALVVHTVYKKLTLKDAVLVIIGSLGNADGIFKTQLHKKIKDLVPQIEIIPPLIDPAHGATLLAKR